MTTAGTTRPRNPYAVASVAMAVATTVVMLVTRFATVYAPLLVETWRLPLGAIGGILSALGGAGVLLALVGAALGVVGVTRPRLPHALAAAGMAIGITAAGTYLLNLLSVTLVTAAIEPR